MNQRLLTGAIAAWGGDRTNNQDMAHQEEVQKKAFAAQVRIEPEQSQKTRESIHKESAQGLLAQTIKTPLTTGSVTY